MFLVRSAFWLTVAFVAMHPHDVDLGAAASALSGQALNAGQRIVAEQVLTGASTPAVAAAIIRSAALVPAAPAPKPNTPSIDPTMQDSSMFQPAPFPRQRPAWMG